MLRTALGFLICTLGCVAAHPGCFTDDREPDSDKTALSFCPETQWGGGETIEFGSCCTDLEEEEAEIQFLAAGTVSAGCEPLYKEFVCGQCHSFSGHLFERLGAELGPWDGLTLTEEFCEELVNQCSPDITFPVYDGGSLSFCEKHVGDVDQYYAYPFEEGELFTGGLVEAFPDIPLYERPGYLMHMQQSPDGSMYWFAGREGQISKVLASDTGTIELVVNIGGSYEDAGIDKYLLFSIEEGLQGFCFDPNFADNGFFYTTYTVQGTEVAYQRTSRFTYVEGDPTATRASQQLLYDAGPRVVFIHNGGWLGFKPSDYGKGNDWNDLYVAIGDGADFHDPSGTTQDLTNLMGSIIRLSVPSAPESSGYSIPEGNYEDLTGVAALPELCAVGLRNPFRCGFDRDTDELYCGDVGQDKVETIKNIKCGSNYGWGIFEGSRCQSEVENNGVYPSCSSADRSLYTFPIFEYCHIGYYADSEEEQVYTNTEDLCGNRLIEGNSAIGGPVYRGTSFSDILGGALLFADYTMQTVNYLKQDCDGIWQPGRLEFGGAVQVYSFFEDLNGEVMFLTSTGEIFHLPCGDLCSGDPNPALHPSVSECNAPSPVTPDSAAPPTTAPQGEEFPVAGGYVELGCAADPKPGQDGGRLMSEGPILDEGSMSAEICFGICQDNLPGFEYFGTQWSIECFCATTLPDDLSFDPEYEGCDFTCAGSPDGEICGGYEAITVYTVADME